MHIDGLYGVGVGIFVLVVMRFFPHITTQETQALPWLAIGVFGVAPISTGVVRLLGGDPPTAFCVGAFSVLPVAAVLAASAIWHRRRRAEFLLTAVILTVVGLGFGTALIGETAAAHGVR